MAASPLLQHFQEHQRALVAYMAARLRCRTTANDLAQELFLKVCALDGGPEIGNAKAYLFRAAANLVTDHERREHRHRCLLAEARHLLDGDAAVPSPERQVMAAEELKDLARAVEQMTPTTRRIFKLNRYEGKTQKEIARTFGISQTAVEKHIRKALRQLAAHRHER
jgi:RNA polymerase sigma-70 factor (ECF subfamily)